MERFASVPWIDALVGELVRLRGEFIFVYATLFLVVVFNSIHLCLDLKQPLNIKAFLLLAGNLLLTLSMVICCMLEVLIRDILGPKLGFDYINILTFVFFVGVFLCLVNVLSMVYRLVRSIKQKRQGTSAS